MQARVIFVESWLVRVKSQELSSHFGSWVCRLESWSSQMKFAILPKFFFYCYEMALSELPYGAQFCYSNVDSRLHSFKFVVKAVSTLGLHLFFTLSHFHKSSTTLLQKIYFPAFQKNEAEKMTRGEHGLGFGLKFCLILVFWCIWIL